MGNIIGDPFDIFVKRQIEARQKSLGQVNISSEDLKYYNTKTPWLRLASSIDLITKELLNTMVESGGGKDEGGDTVLDRLVKAGVPEEIIIRNNLAKSFILQGGTLGIDDDGNTSLKKGLNYNNELFTGAYGWGGISERGFVPMPGIESAKSTYYNNGALSKATINIKCFSKTQFQLLDVLYLRPGYTLLLEFGWSTYLNSNPDTNNDGIVNDSDLTVGSLQTFDGFKSEPLNFLLDPNSFPGGGGQFKMLDLINNERKKHSGNYEAIYGKVTNFKWSFSSDGSYNCEVTLIGMGSIVESLKLNVSDPSKDNQSKEDEDSSSKYNKSFEEFIIDYWGVNLGGKVNSAALFGHDPSDWTKTYKNQLKRSTDSKLTGDSTVEQIHDWIRPKYNEEKNRVITVETKNDNNNPIIANKDDTRLNKLFYRIDQNAQTSYSSVGGDGGVFAYEHGITDGSFILNDTLNGETSSKKEGGAKATKSVWIKFAVLLKIIEDNCNLFTRRGHGGTPIVQFDFDYKNMKNDQNFMLIIPPNFSTNPQKCLTAWNKMSIGNIQYDEDILTNTPLNKSLLANQHFLVDNNPYIGRLGNVLLNLRFVSSAFSSAPMNDDGAISVLDYLKTILDGINDSLGNVNDFKVTYDEYDGVIKIFDQSPKPGLVTDNIDEFSKINIFGVRPNEGSFVTNIGLDAEIPQNMATLIVIGSQASGNNLMGNAVSFQNYNRGLIDRVIPEKIDFDSKLTKEEKPDDIAKAKKNKNEKIYYVGQDKISPFSSMYLPQQKDGGSNLSEYNFTTEVSHDLTENYKSYIQLVQGILASNNTIPSPFFLPFNLNLELEGISGIKIFEKFRISDDILPPSYEKDSVDIVVKGINHDVDVQTWKTTIDTLSVPRHKPMVIEAEEVKTSPQTSEKQEKLEAAVKEEPPVDENKDPILRIRLTRLVDNDYQTLGLMEVLNESGGVLYALPTVELPWDNNKNKKSCIPTGTYNVASRNSPKYGDCFIISTLDNRKEILSSGMKIPGSNDTDRTYVLIHEAPAAMGSSKAWLEGCMAPGFKFNTRQRDSKNKNPRGTGPEYGGKTSKSHLESIQANQKLIGTLWGVGKDPMFKLEIKTLGSNVNKPMERDFYAMGPQSEIRRIENITGEKYQYPPTDKGVSPGDLVPTPF